MPPYYVQNTVGVYFCSVTVDPAGSFATAAVEEFETFQEAADTVAALNRGPAVSRLSRPVRWFVTRCAPVIDLEIAA
jgi:hypothetical protein